MKFASLAPLLLLMPLALQADPDPQIDKLAHEGYWVKGKASEKIAMEMLNKPAPAISLTGWHGTKPETTGKIVLIDFWATWCGPCLAQIPHANEMAKKYADRGVVVYGACCKEGAEKMVQTAKEKKMEYPTGKLNEATTKAWDVSFWPTYAVIDRKGNLRALGLEPGHVEPVLEALLAEQPK